MATRGLVGFYTKGITKGVYHHRDASLDALGNRLIEYLAQTDLTKLTQRASEWMEHVTPYPGMALLDGPVILEWAELQRRLEDDTADLTIAENADFSFFLYRRLFCEYAYILNLDTQELEIYQGGLNHIGESGRYSVIPDEWKATVNSFHENQLEKMGERGIPKAEAEKVVDRDGGVSKVLAIPFAMISNMNQKERQRLMLLFQWIIDSQSDRDANLLTDESFKLQSRYEEEEADHVNVQDGSDETKGNEPAEATVCGDDDDEEDESEACYRQMMKKAMKKTAPVSGLEKTLKSKKERRTIMNGIKLVQVGV